MWDEDDDRINDEDIDGGLSEKLIMEVEKGQPSKDMRDTLTDTLVDSDEDDSPNINPSALSKRESRAKKSGWWKEPTWAPKTTTRPTWTERVWYSKTTPQQPPKWPQKWQPKKWEPSTSPPCPSLPSLWMSTKNPWAVNSWPATTTSNKWQPDESWKTKACVAWQTKKYKWVTTQPPTTEDWPKPAWTKPTSSKPVWNPWTAPPAPIKWQPDSWKADPWNAWKSKSQPPTTEETWPNQVWTKSNKGWKPSSPKPDWNPWAAPPAPNKWQPDKSWKAEETTEESWPKQVWTKSSMEWKPSSSKQGGNPWANSPTPNKWQPDELWKGKSWNTWESKKYKWITTQPPTTEETWPKQVWTKPSIVWKPSPSKPDWNPWATPAPNKWQPENSWKADAWNAWKSKTQPPTTEETWPSQVWTKPSKGWKPPPTKPDWNPWAAPPSPNKWQPDKSWMVDAWNAWKSKTQPPTTEETWPSQVWTKPSKGWKPPPSKPDWNPWTPPKPPKLDNPWQKKSWIPSSKAPAPWWPKSTPSTVAPWSPNPWKYPESWKSKPSPSQPVKSWTWPGSSSQTFEPEAPKWPQILQISKFFFNHANSNKKKPSSDKVWVMSDSWNNAWKHPQTSKDEGSSWSSKNKNWKRDYLSYLLNKDSRNESLKDEDDFVTHFIDPDLIPLEGA
ncbi:unnamed protein product [Gordionus sp. m RMFG-2023]